MGRYDRIDEVRKYNQNHDNLGRFSSSAGGGAGGPFQKLSHADAVAMAGEMGQNDIPADEVNQLLDRKYGYFGTRNSFTINAKLREAEERGQGDAPALDSDSRTTIETMDRNMKPSTRDIELHRMIGTSFMKALGIDGVDLNSPDANEKLKAAEGKIYENPGYTSSSFDMGDNLFKGKLVTMHINAPKGTKMLVSPARYDNEVDEAEIVLARRTAMVVKSVRAYKTDYGKTKIEAFLDVINE